MTLAKLLTQCASDGVRLQAVGDRLSINAPTGWITDSYRREMIRRKPDILRWLAARARLDDAIADAAGTLAGWHRRERAEAIGSASRSLAGYAVGQLADAFDADDIGRFESMERYAAFLAGRIRRHARDERFVGIASPRGEPANCF